MRITRVTRVACALAASALAIAGLAGLAAGSTAAAASPTYTCFGKPATIVGTPGDDVLVGRENTADVIVGLGGDDVIRGSADVTSSTAPGDRLCGGHGDDYIRGAVGADRIQGGRGNDDVDGSFGVDLLVQGGRGNDRVSDCDSEYTGGARKLEGGPGADTMCIDTDPTRMLGGHGDDKLYDYDCSSNSVLRGGVGDDRIESWYDNLNGLNCSDFTDPGHDVVDGGDGTDTVVVNHGDTLVSNETVHYR